MLSVPSKCMMNHLSYRMLCLFPEFPSLPSPFLFGIHLSLTSPPCISFHFAQSSSSQKRDMLLSRVLFIYLSVPRAIYYLCLLSPLPVCRLSPSASYHSVHLLTLPPHLSLSDQLFISVMYIE